MTLTKVLLMLALVFSIEAHALPDNENPIDDRFQEAQDTVYIGTPTYQGLKFLATRAIEAFELDSFYEVRLLNSRADAICRYLGYGQSKSVSRLYFDESDYKYSHAKKYSARLWHFDEGDTLVVGGWYFGYYEKRTFSTRIVTRLSYIGNLSCKKD